MNTLIHTDLIKEVLSNFHAYEIVHCTDLQVHSSVSPGANYLHVTIEELADLRGFDMKMVNEILYAREVKFRFPVQFKQALEGITHPPKYAILQKLRYLKQEDYEQIFKDENFIPRLESRFPSMDIYKVAGIPSETPKNFIIFFPSYFDEGYDYPMIKFFEEKGFSGSTVIRLRISQDIGNFFYMLLKEKKIDAIINYFTDGASQCNWYDFRDILTRYLLEPDKKEVDGLLKNVPKNLHGQDHQGGFNYREVNEMLEKLKN